MKKTPVLKKAVKWTQLNMRIPDKILRELDKYIDDVRFRNRSQLITVILSRWIDDNKAFGVQPRRKPKDKT